MVRTPSCKFLIYKLTIFIKQGIGKYREGKHILLSNCRNNFHEYLLMLNKFIYIINCKRTIRKLKSTEKCFIIFSIKDRNIYKCTLVNSHKRLIKPVNQLLKGLSKIIIRIINNIICLTISLPEIECPNKNIRDSYCARRSIAHKTNVFNNIIQECSQVFRRLRVIIL